ncbi:MAG: glycosyltransferase [Planctomycetota bacterium]
MSSLKTSLINLYRLATLPVRSARLNRWKKKGNVPVSILFYHRVADEHPNPWTISEGDFERQIRWFQKNFDLVSMEECQRRMESGFNDRPALHLTFDDGYADNCSFALPFLIEQKIPVTYFITTRHLVEHEPFAHDVKEEQPLLPNSIEAIRALADAGVEIGGHTRTHADLGSIADEERLYDEVITATREMERLISRPIRYFAFPYGQVANLNPAVFRMLKDEGFKGVCSAYGGFNAIGDDSFHLQRIHADPVFERVRNWLTFDPRITTEKRYVWASAPAVKEIACESRVVETMEPSNIDSHTRSAETDSDTRTVSQAKTNSEAMNDSNRPLRTMFVITSMPVGGAETLLVNMVRKMDRSRIEPMICCLKHKDVLGEELSEEIPVFENLIRHKFDVGVMGRLRKLYDQNKVDAVITVGAGDKMFWGRLSARRAGLPVILSALHSTGWPDGVGRMNRLLTPATDGFIAVAESHAEFLVEFEKFPTEKVFMIPNGIDTSRFVFSPESRTEWRSKLGIPEDSPVVGIVAALRPEKNHELFLRAAKNVRSRLQNAHFVIAGDGPEREGLEKLTRELELESCVHFAGSISDIPGVLSMVDLFALTSHNEAKPVSILEAMSCTRPVVATDVGSVSESVLDGRTGYLVPEGNLAEMTQRWLDVLTDPESASRMGNSGRSHIIENSSLESMTEGYIELVERLFRSKNPWHGASNPAPGSILPPLQAGPVADSGSFVS